MTGLRHLYHLTGLGLIVATTAFFLYASRFWIWTAPWGNDGLFGLKAFPPYGDVLRRWLGGTWFRDFDIVIWGCAAILLLSILQWLGTRYKG